MADQPRTSQSGPDASAQSVSHGEPDVFSAELNRFAMVLRERTGPDGTVSRVVEVYQAGKPLWRLSERDLEQLAAFTGQMDRGLTRSAATLLDFREATRAGPQKLGVLELRSEALPYNARLGGLEATITELRVNQSTGQVSYGGRLSFGGRSIKFNQPDIAELHDLSRDMKQVLHLRDQGISLEEIARQRVLEAQPELAPEVEPEP